MHKVVARPVPLLRVLKAQNGETELGSSISGVSSIGEDLLFYAIPQICLLMRSRLHWIARHSRREIGNSVVQQDC